MCFPYSKMLSANLFVYIFNNSLFIYLFIEPIIMRKLVAIIVLIATVGILSANPTSVSPVEQNTVIGSKKMTDSSLMGHVKDKKSGEHLAFITIAVKGTTLGVATDHTGHYFMKNLPLGKFTLIASAVGYKSVEKQVEIKLGQTHTVNFELAEDAVMLDNVVVTANRGETKRREASNIVNVLSPKIFETTNSTCLAQGLNFQPGVRVENDCQNCGFTQVRINGLDGPYTQMLVNGRAISGALAGVYGLEQIPANMIERVEVVRGGGSALYGSNAIAGTINIITKEPLRNMVTVNNTTSLIGGTKADFNTGFNAALVSDDSKYGVSLYGTSKTRQGWDANDDGYTEVGEIKGHNLGMTAYFKTSLQTKLTLEYHNTHEYRRGGDSLILPAHDTNIAEMLEHNINMGGAKFDWFTRDSKHRMQIYSSAQHIVRDSYYGGGKDLNSYGLTTDLTAVGGIQYVYSMDNCLFMPANLTVGAEYNHNHLVDNSLGQSDASGNHVAKVKTNVDQKVNIYSGYAQNEWKNTRWTMLLGVRLDKHSMLADPVVSPRANFRYNPTSWLTFRTGYAMGFRAPQAFDEDLHIGLVQGEHVVIKNDANLRSEKSHAFNLSADFTQSWDDVQFNFLIDGFYNILTDVFNTDSIAPLADGTFERLRVNMDQAIVRGVNLEARVVPMDELNIQLGSTIQQSFYNGDVDDKILRAPNLYGYLTANYNPTRALTLSASGTYTGSMPVEYLGTETKYGAAPDPDNGIVVDTDDFFDMNLKASYDFKLGTTANLQLSLAVQNVFNSYQKDFDKGADRDAGYVYGPSLPRSYVVGLKYSL